MKEKVKALTGNLRRYWNRPPAGRYMSYKEILSLSGGGIGVKFIVYCISNMMLAVGNTLIGNTIGIGPKPLYVIYLLGILSSFPLTGIRAYMIDNTRSMKGKYRPYLIRMGIPTVLLGIGFIWMPYESMSLTSKCVTVLAFNIGFQFFYNFMNDAYDSLINVLSPNTVERSDVCSVKAVIENFSPSIAGIFLPLAARLITGDNTLYDLRVYRVLYPPMLIVGFLISLMVYVGTEEKIVQAKTHTVQIKFLDAFRAVMRNKYFWIISLAGWLGFLESSFNNIMGWMYNYRKACSAGQYSLITAISGNASFWPNLVAPFFIRRYGKRAILIFTNLLNIGFILLMLPIIKRSGSGSIIWLLLFCQFVNQFITSLGHLMNPSLNADIRDYQQYITGERIDGMFSAVGLIGNVITLVGSFILPLLSDRAGLNAATAVSLGYSGSNVYDVLFDETYFVKVCSVMVLASVVGAVMNVIPFFFYDLTETRQRAMVAVLKVRAFFEDYGNDALTDESLVETVDIIESAKRLSGRELKTLSGEALSAARKSRDKAAVQAAKKARKELRAENEQIEIAALVNAELLRFTAEAGQKELQAAQKLAEAGPGETTLDAKEIRKAAKALPHTTRAEKDARREGLMLSEKLATAKRAVKKYYPNGIEPFDRTVFDRLFAAEDANALAIHETLMARKAALEAGDKGKAVELKNKLTLLTKEKSDIARSLKKATAENSVYTRAAKPYLDAVKTLRQAENYSRYAEIARGYADAAQRIASRAND